MKNPQYRRAAWLLYALLGVLYLLHNDVWLWNDARLVFGLPMGLVYHFFFCIAVSAVLGLLVVYAWPPWKARSTPAAPGRGEGGRP
jgi:hypothetical protein